MRLLKSDLDDRLEQFVHQSIDHQMDSINRMCTKILGTAQTSLMEQQAHNSMLLPSGLPEYAQPISASLLQLILSLASGFAYVLHTVRALVQRNILCHEPRGCQRGAQKQSSLRSFSMRVLCTNVGFSRNPWLFLTRIGTKTFLRLRETKRRVENICSEQSRLANQN